MAKTREKQANLKVYKDTETQTPVISVGTSVDGIRTIPVIMMVPGVHNGSHGAVLHTEESLSVSAEQWNGKPIVVHHPQDEAGNYISANTEGVQTVGKITNCRYENKALRADMEIQEQTLLACSPQAYEAIINALPTDVSIGAYTQEEEEVGNWNGEDYIAVAKAYNPDHLAILPGEVGACSWADGCGIRVNQKQNKKIGGTEMTKFKDIIKNGLSVFSLQNNIGDGFQERLDAMWSIISSMDDETAYHYLEEVFPNYVIYKKRIRTGNGEGEYKYYKQSYAIEANEQLKLTGDPVEVTKKVTYQILQNNKEEQKMKNKLVDGLITNKATQWTEDDRENLMTLSECTLKKMNPVVEKPTEVHIEVNAETVSSYLGDLNDDEILNVLPDSLKKEITANREAEKNKREALIKGITETDTEWKEDELKEMSTNALQKLSKTVTGQAGTEQVDYSGAGRTPQVNTGGGVEPMLPLN